MTENAPLTTTCACVKCTWTTSWRLTPRTLKLAKSSLARQLSKRSKSESDVDDDLPAANHPGEEPQAEVVEQANNFDDVRAELEPADEDPEVVVQGNNFDHLPAEHKPVNEEAKVAQQADDFDGLPAEDVEQDNNFDDSPAENELVDEEVEVVQQADDFNVLPAEVVEQANNIDDLPAVQELLISDQQVRFRPQLLSAEYMRSAMPDLPSRQ
ncbi:hypothetical protein FN846DRAFT_886263 [Sphaerosporella brunnea]|uniref:Uncharacterized protein n=1 Tax=Sphaerosporella brunnea TaxID=1250544 RepID=A0A5J5FAB0_9PEZI|nr:hypothetical protein FN846DRAFT_886263 [Sphaerosporella brunnea]